MTPAELTTHIEFREEGSLCLFRPLTDRAQAWLDEHVGDDALTWGTAIVVEPRYAEALIEGMLETL